MQDRRYPEGGDSVPSLSFTTSSDSKPSVVEKLRTKRRTTYIVPNKAKRSSTSSASECFVKREFSQKLQNAMLNYAYTLVTTQVLSGEL